jgi:hypothetical protein
MLFGRITTLSNGPKFEQFYPLIRFVCRMHHGDVAAQRVKAAALGLRDRKDTRARM